MTGHFQCWSWTSISFVDPGTTSAQQLQIEWACLWMSVQLPHGTWLPSFSGILLCLNQFTELCVFLFLEQELKAQISLFNQPHCFMFVSFKSLSEICVLGHMCQSVRLHNMEEVFSWGFFTLELRRGITNSSELFGWHMHSNQTRILLLVCVSTHYWWCHVWLWF